MHCLAAPRLDRRAFLASALGGAALAVSRVGAAQATLVPARIQADLLAKVAAYDRNFAARAGERAKVLLLSKGGDADSTAFVTEMKSALASIPTVGDLPHDEEMESYLDAGALAEECKSRKVAIVYLGPGLGKQIEAIRDAMTGVDILSVGGVADYVPSGIVLGFDLLYGKPKLLVNAEQARKQHVEFRAEVLRLMKVY